jgi:ferric-dicitrate binding protein FerR (iron transport regulator)
MALESLSDPLWGDIADYISGQATPEAAAATQARRATDPVFATHLARAEALWALPVPHDTPAITPIRRSRRGRYWLLATSALAASLLLGLRVYYCETHPFHYYRAGTVAQRVTLPDSSIAELSPGAYLGTSRSYIDGARTLYLFGEARFHVTPNPRRPFTVQALGVEATALGTTFAIASDTQPHVTVTVQSGKISVILLSANGGRRSLGVLTAGKVQNIPALTQWFAREGYLLASAGVSLHQAAEIQTALLRAAATVATPAR